MLERFSWYRLQQITFNFNKRSKRAINLPFFYILRPLQLMFVPGLLFFSHGIKSVLTAAAGSQPICGFGLGFLVG